MIWQSWFRSLCDSLRTRSRRRKGCVYAPAVEGLEERQLLTVQILFDYSYDSTGFFNDSSRRALLEQAAALITSRLSDNLLSINPSGSNSWTAFFANPSTGSIESATNLFVPSNSLLVYVGARDFNGGELAEGGAGGFSLQGDDAWHDRVVARGQSGALGMNPVDYAPWGGSLSFDSVGTNWHFSTSTAGLDSNEMDFLSVAEHELGHLLGIGSAESWWHYVSGSVFTGPHATTAYDGTGNPPLNSDRAHWQNGLTDGNQEAAMDPSLTPGTRKLFTSLDFAALYDIGWNNDSVEQPQNGVGVAITPTTSLQTSETGLTASFSMALTPAPTANVTISLSVSDATEGSLSTSLLTFTPQNWNVPQLVTVTGLDDNLQDGNQTYTIVTTANSNDARYRGLAVDDLTVTNIDDDSNGISVSPTSGLLTSEAGGQSSFTVSLTTQPTANVYIPVGTSNSKEGVPNVSQLLFTPGNWDVPQIVTVTGVNDFKADGNTSYTILLGVAQSADPKYNGLNPPDVQVLNLAAANIPPIITLNGSDATYQKDGVATYLDRTATIVDPDTFNPPVNGARLTVSLLSNGNKYDRLEVGGGMNGVTVSSDGVNVRYNGSTVATRSGGSTTPMVLTFNSRATLEAVQAVLRSVTFRSTSSNKSSLTRTVGFVFTLADGTTSNLATKAVNVTTGDSPPVVTFNDDATVYINGTGAQLVDTTVTVDDPDSINFSGGKLVIAMGAGFEAGDLLSIRREGRKVGQIDAAKDGTIRFSGRAIAYYSGGRDGRDLVITLKSTATEAGVQALLRNLMFETSQSNSALGERELLVTLTDGDGGTSIKQSKMIDVIGGAQQASLSKRELKHARKHAARPRHA